MKKIILLCSVLLILSCIKFRYQRMDWSYDETSDVLRIFQQYEGIYVDGEKLDANEMKEYQRLKKNQNTYFFANWIFEFPGTEIKEKLESGKEEDPLVVEFMTILDSSITIQNGDWFENDQGELCGSQKVTVKDVSKILELSNKLLERHWKKAWSKAATGRAFPEAIKYVEIKNNQLICRFPVPYGEFKKAKAELIEKLKKDSKLFEIVMNVLKQDVQVNYRDSVLEVVVGEAGKAINSIESVTAMEGKYSDTLKERVAQDYELKKQGPSSSREAFFK